MLSAIIPLPSFQMMSIDNRRRVLRDVDSIFFPIDYADRKELYFPTFEKYPITKENMIAGTNFEHLGKDIFKSVRFSYDGRYGFETIFSREKDKIVCWYTRVISTNGVINLISVRGVQHLSNFYETIDALGNLIEPYDNPRKSSDSRITAVPYIHDNSSFYKYIDHLIIDCHMVPRYYNHRLFLTPLIEHNVQDLYGLTNGMFMTSPFMELVSDSFHYDHKRYRHSVWDEIQNITNVRNASLKINHRDFDNMVNLAIHTDFDFSICIPIENIVNRIPFVNIIYDFHDPYRLIFGFDNERKKNCDKTILSFFEEALSLYLKTSYRFSGSRYDFKKSTVTIIKRNTEEIALIIYDDINSQTLCFYSCIPAIIMTTLSLGMYDTS